ncbi:MAG: hypothetical protein U0802_02750 [Candidatus Binatia bacterium]
MAELIRCSRRHAAGAAPSMREVPLAASPEATALLEDLAAGAVDAVVLLTGVGTRALATASGLAADVPAARLAARVSSRAVRNRWRCCATSV